MYNVALVGLGNIGFNYDKNKDDKSKSLSHLKAIYLHNHFTLKYAVDLDSSHFKEVINFFPMAQCFNNHKNIINNQNIDILVIATPTHTHFEILCDFSTNMSIKLFFIEKPLFLDANNYLSLSQSLRDKIVVNYLRRFDSAIQKLKEEIHKKQNVDKIIINYCKGLKNNGSHMIDLLNFLFNNPEIISSKILSTSIGFNDDDPSYDIYLTIKFNKQIIPVYFISHNHNKYNLIELIVYNNDSMIRYTNSKHTIDYYDIQEDKNFAQYKIFNNNPRIEYLNNNLIMNDAYNHIIQVIDNKNNNLSSFKNEILNIKFLNKILKGIKNE